MSKWTRKKTSAAIWKESVYHNRFHCTKCHRKLFNGKDEFTSNVCFHKMGERTYGTCVCGEPVVIVEENYDGEQKSEDWETQLKMKHEDEARALKAELSAVKRERGELKAKLEEERAARSAADKRIMELNAQIDKLKGCHDATVRTYERRIAEIIEEAEQDRNPFLQMYKS